MAGLSLKGDIYIGIFEDGDFKGYLPEILNVDELSFVAPESETHDRISHKRVTDGQTLDSYIQATSAATMTLATDEQLPEIMAINLSGWATEVDISGDEVEDEEVTLHLNRWTKLENVNLKTDGISVSDNDGAVDSNKYEIDHRTGMIMAVDEDLDGKKVKVTYDFTSITGYKYTGLTNLETRCRIFGDMEDRVTRRRGELVVHDVRFSIGEEVNLMLTEGFLRSVLEGKLITPPGKDGPFEFRFIDDAENGD